MKVLVIKHRQMNRLKSNAGGGGSLNNTPNQFVYPRSNNIDPNIIWNGFASTLNGGGIVPGSGPNKDTVPAMLTPGEFVMSRGAVQNIGVLIG